jgi:hypothetical protein
LSRWKSLESWDRDLATAKLASAPVMSDAWHNDDEGSPLAGSACNPGFTGEAPPPPPVGTATVKMYASEESVPYDPKTPVPVTASPS